MRQRMLHEHVSQLVWEITRVVGVNQCFHARGQRPEPAVHEWTGVVRVDDVDMQVSKEFTLPFREGMGVTFNAQFSNLLNHFQPSFTAGNLNVNSNTPYLNIDSPQNFGVLTQQGNTPRQIEFGLRLHF